MRKSRIAAAAIAFALLATGYAAWWLHAAEGLRAGVFAWAEARRAEGWQVSLDDVTVGGFPFALTAVAQRFSIGRAAPVGWRWTGPRLAASAPPWLGRTVTLSAPGAHSVEYDAPDGRKTVPFTAVKAGGKVHVGDDRRIDRIDAGLAGIAATLPDRGEVKIDRIDLVLSGAPKPATAPADNSPFAPEAGRLTFNAEGIEMPDRAASPLGPRIGRAEIDAVLRGAIPGGTARAALDAWREAGGTIELKKLRLIWGEFQLEAEGTAALDSELQPIGALTTRVWGVGKAIDALVAAGSVRPREGATAKVVLHVMAKPQRVQGVPPEVEAPLAVQDRRLYLGPVAIAPVPHVAWP